MRPVVLVGAAGFEPAAPCAQGRCATRLRYAPTPPLSHAAAESAARRPSHPHLIEIDIIQPMDSKTPLLRSVSDTALLVAYHRAMETKRPDSLFRDQFAVRLSDGRGEEIARKLRHGRAMAWTTIVRAVLIDDIVTCLVAGASTAS